MDGDKRELRGRERRALFSLVSKFPRPFIMSTFGAGRESPKEIVVYILYQEQKAKC